MKKIVLLLALLTAGFALHAQSQEAYVKAMSKGLENLWAAESQEDRQAVASQFERIAAKVKDQWHPHYYAALANINMSSATNIKAFESLKICIFGSDGVGKSGTKHNLQNIFYCMVAYCESWSSPIM